MLEDAYRGHNLVFVVGCPRSGTTWVQRLLAAHPRVRTGQESDVFDLYVGPQLRTWRRELRATDGRGGVGLAAHLEEGEFVAALRRYMLALLEPMVGGLVEGELFLEKTPSHAVFLDEIHELLPDARFVHVLRDARDVVASLLAAHRSWGSAWAPGDPRLAAEMWVQHVQAARKGLAGLGRDKALEIRYEELEADTFAVLADVSRFLGLEWATGALRAAVDRNTAAESRSGRGTPIAVGGELAAAGAGTVVEPQGFVRKARSGGWREDLSARERVAVWRAARAAMADVGYRWTLPL